jgi:hypothetical protein
MNQIVSNLGKICVASIRLQKDAYLDPWRAFETANHAAQDHESTASKSFENQQNGRYLWESRDQAILELHKNQSMTEDLQS